MGIVIVLTVSMVLWAVLVLWQLKTKIYKKKGRILSNAELFTLVQEGDSDAVKLRQMTKLFFIVGLAVGLLFLCTKYQYI